MFGDQSTLVIRVGNSLLLVIIAIYFLFSPILIITDDLNDVGLYNGQVPEFTYRWHKEISSGFEVWANQRVESNRAKHLDINNISGTEWPMFSAVYYLWATEELQTAWVSDPSLSEQEPIVYSEGAIRAAARLITDKGNAAWVIKHWGDEYLERENLFYRMLLISGLTSFQKLMSDSRYENLLRDQSESLAKELDSSPHGLLDDYPGQSYPVDILPAYAAIQRAGNVFNENYSDFVTRSQRAFSGNRLDPKTQLPAYITDSHTGYGYGPARGVGISYMLIWATELWPDLTQDWYKKYDEHFWQQGWFMAGVREFSVNSKFPSWLVDVDAGPVISGYGTAASAFGIGAARVNGRFDHAYPLSAEALAASWPLPNGTLLLPRLLSNLSDAPFVGEAAMLFAFTRKPISQNSTALSSSNLPIFVYLVLFLYFVFGLVFILLAYVRLKRDVGSKVFWSRIQTTAWCLITLCGCIALAVSKVMVAVMCVLFMLCFPLQNLARFRSFNH